MKRQPTAVIKAQKIAVSGISAAGSLTLLYVGSLLPFSSYAAPVFSGLFLLPLLVEFGRKTALLAYAAVGLISVFVFYDKEASLLFLLIAGYYPILRSFFLRFRSSFLSWCVKLIYFNAIFILFYLLIHYLLFSPLLQSPWKLSGGIYLLLLAVLGNITFILYDILVEKLRIIYLHRIHRHLFRS